MLPLVTGVISVAETLGVRLFPSTTRLHRRAKATLEWIDQLPAEAQEDRRKQVERCAALLTAREQYPVANPSEIATAVALSALELLAPALAGDLPAEALRLGVSLTLTGLLVALWGFLMTSWLRRTARRAELLARNVLTAEVDLPECRLHASLLLVFSTALMSVAIAVGWVYAADVLPPVWLVLWSIAFGAAVFLPLFTALGIRWRARLVRTRPAPDRWAGSLWSTLWFSRQQGPVTGESPRDAARATATD